MGTLYLYHLAFVINILFILASGKPEKQVFRQPEEGRKLIKATNAFALDLYRNLARTDGKNVFLSPASISIALGMTQLGAKNNTLTEMANALHFNEVSPNHLHESLSDLLGALKTSNKYYILHTANRLYGQQGYNFLESFLEATRKHYSAELKAVNFSNEAKTRQEINAWVEEQTNNKIKNLIPSGVLDSLTRLVLVNAIYFKGDWRNKFDQSETRIRDFHVSSMDTVKVPMMHMSYKKFMWGHSNDLKAKALELPYKGGKLSMVLLLPDDIEGLNALENQLTSEHLMNLYKSFNMMKVKPYLSIPKFKLEASFSLKSALQQLGMNDPFDMNKADFSGIDSTNELSISEMVHKAFINVDEEGSEAAAATIITLGEADEFQADHPFLFMIRENETGCILFLGRMMNPPMSDSVSVAKSEL